MKKAALLAMAILFVCISAGLAAAAGYKPPKNTCYRMYGATGTGTFNNGTAVLNIKSSGMKSQSLNGSVPIYTASAVLSTSGTPQVVEIIMSGQGYFVINDDYFKMSLVGSYYQNIYGCMVEMFPDRTPLFRCSSGSAATYYEYSTSVLDCSTISLQ